MPKSACVERRVQYGWRLVAGQAKYICYHLYALPKSPNVPEVPGLRTRQSEYGIEIILTVAFLTLLDGNIARPCLLGGAVLYGLSVE